MRTAARAVGSAYWRPVRPKLIGPGDDFTAPLPSEGYAVLAMVLLCNVGRSRWRGSRGRGQRRGARRIVRSGRPARPARRREDAVVRKLKVSTFVTLDGVMQAPGGPDEDRSSGFTHGGWSLGFWDDRVGQGTGAFMGGPLGVILGSRADLTSARSRPPPSQPRPARLET